MLDKNCPFIARVWLSILDIVQSKILWAVKTNNTHLIFLCKRLYFVTWMCETSGVIALPVFVAVKHAMQLKILQTVISYHVISYVIIIIY